MSQHEADSLAPAKRHPHRMMQSHYSFFGDPTVPAPSPHQPPMFPPFAADPRLFSILWPDDGDDMACLL